MNTVQYIQRVKIQRNTEGDIKSHSWSVKHESLGCTLG